jgi:hypothetical protein
MTTGTCPRCGQTEYVRLGGMAPHMLPGDDALIECSGTGQPPLGEPGPLEAVVEATAAKASVERDAEDADRAWREAIRTAIIAGFRVVAIAEAAGISRDRVYQIRDGRR